MLHVWYLYSECVMTCISHAGPHAISISLLSSPFSHTRTYSWPSPLGRHPALASFSSARLKVHQSTTMHCSNITTPLACIPHGISYWAYANYRNIQVLDEHGHATGFGKDGVWAQDHPWKGERGGEAGERGEMELTHGPHMSDPYHHTCSMPHGWFSASYVDLDLMCYN